MRNSEIAKVLFGIANLLEMHNVPFKPKAYSKAARTVESIPEELADVYRKGGKKALMDIPSIGIHIAEKIEELLRTGKLRYYDDLKKQFPMNVEELMRVPGMGPKRVMLIYQKLGVKNLDELQKAAHGKKIRKIPGLGPTVEQNILHGAKIVEAGEKRSTLGDIAEIAHAIRSRLAALKSVKKVEIAGSYRRGKETVGDLDFLVISSNPKEAMDTLTTMPEVKGLIAKGKTKSAVRLANNLEVDVRVLGENEFGSALQYFTGSKDHNVALRRIANSKGLTLNEYGLFTLKGDRRVAGKTEEEIYEKLGLQYVEPELRESQGEIEAAQKGKLPKLIKYEDVKGDLQTQTKWSDGSDSIEDMANEAMGMGHKFIAITDHGGGFLKIAHALEEDRVKEQAKEIDKLNEKLGIRILKGTEVDILKDGTLALPKSALKELDFVLASVHSSFKMPEEEMTKRIVSAIENYPIHALAHPTGRVINQREPYAVNLEKVYEACKATGTFLEIDGYPSRLDLKDVHIRAARKLGCRFTVSSDAHSKSHMRFIEYAVTQARRGWLEAKDVLNTYSVDKIEKELEKRK